LGLAILRASVTANFFFRKRSFNKEVKTHSQESANLQIAYVNVMDSVLTADYKACSSAVLVVSHSALSVFDIIAVAHKFQKSPVSISYILL